jgi:hypothetical protein
LRNCGQAVRHELKIAPRQASKAMLRGSSEGE